MNIYFYSIIYFLAQSCIEIFLEAMSCTSHHIRHPIKTFMIRIPQHAQPYIRILIIVNVESEHKYPPTSGSDYGRYKIVSIAFIFETWYLT